MIGIASLALFVTASCSRTPSDAAGPGGLGRRPDLTLQYYFLSSPELYYRGVATAITIQRTVASGDSTGVFETLSAVAARSGAALFPHPFTSWTFVDPPDDRLDVLLDGEKLRGAAPDTYPNNPLLGRPTPDLVLDSGEHLSRLLAAGFYAPMGELLRAYGKNLLGSFPRTFWDANSVGGELMGVPVSTTPRRSHWVIRGDLRERLGFPPIDSYAALVRLVSELARTEAVRYPVLVSPRYDLTREVLAHYGLFGVGGLPAPVLYTVVADPATVRSGLDDPVPEIGQSLRIIAAARAAGFANGETLPAYQQKVLQRVYGAEWGIWHVEEDDPAVARALQAMTAARPEVRFELLLDGPLGQSIPVPYRAQGQLCIPASSPHKIEVVRLLDWLATRDGYDLLRYGKKGLHWNPVGDREYVPVPDAPYPPVVGSYGPHAYLPYLLLCASPFTARVFAGYEGAQKEELLRRMQDQTLFKPDAVEGFTYDGFRTASMVEQFGREGEPLLEGILAGGIPVESGWAQLRRSTGEIVGEVQRDLQAQLRAFLAERKASGTD